MKNIVLFLQFSEKWFDFSSLTRYLCVKRITIILDDDK